MTKEIKIAIEVPDGYELTGEYRLPSHGESYLSAQHPCRAVSGNPALPHGPRFIVRKCYVPPSWIGSGRYLVKGVGPHIESCWYLCDKPTLTETISPFWLNRPGFFNGFTPPPYSPYQVP